MQKQMQIEMLNYKVPLGNSDLLDKYALKHVV